MQKKIPAFYDFLLGKKKNVIYSLAFHKKYFYHSQYLIYLDLLTPNFCKLTSKLLFAS